jgi:4-amino-4-deoxy-L-arabinose transferase-like glycosyltransferase
MYVDLKKQTPRRSVYAAIALFVGLTLYHAAGLNGETVKFEDSAVYVILADALASGQGYTQISYVESAAHVKYPPLFSLLLAPVALFFGHHFLLMKGIVLLFALAALGLMYLFVRSRAGEGKALLALTLVGVAPAFFLYSHEVMSDIPYLCLSLAALHFLRRYSREERWVTGAGAAVLLFTALTSFTRSIGLAFLLVAPLTLWLHKPGGRGLAKLLAAGLFAVLCALPAAGWMVRNAVVVQSASQGIAPERLGAKPLYADFFLAKNEYDADQGKVESLSDLFSRLQHNAYVYGHGTVALLFPAPFPGGDNLMVAVILLPILLGFCSFLWSHKEGEELYVALYGVALLLYPTPQVPRYLVPLFPFLLCYFLSGVEVLASLVSHRLTRMAFAACAVLLLTTTLAATATFSPAADEGLTEYRQVAAWLKTHTTPESVVVSRKPNLLYLWSDRKGMAFPFTADEQKILQALCDKEADYVVQDSFSPVTAKYLAPAVARNRQLFTDVYSKNGTRLSVVDRTGRCRGE